MGKEIERKFLVRHDGWRQRIAKSVHLCQGYLHTGAGSACSIRVRVEGEEARLNIKSATLGTTRTEFDFSIPAADGQAILDELCARPFVEKTRHYVEHAGHWWEIDVFEGENAGLIVAEIELKDADEQFERPEWLGEEVSHDPRYYNVSLVQSPYRNW
ncbi:MAG: CYTH domain-containing protein [Chromatiales bacterium]